MRRAGVLVVGVGNSLLGDEGFGVHVARALASDPRLPSGVRVIEAGTALFDFTPDLARARRAIVVDAIRRGGAPGTLYELELGPESVGGPEESPLSLHEWGVLDSLRAGELLGLVPGRITLLGAEPERVAPGLELTPALALARDRLVTMLVAELAANS